MELKKILNDLLHENDINVAQLSRATKIPRQTLDNWLSGQEPRSLSQVRTIADYFSVTVDFLCFGTVPVPRRTINDCEDEIFAGNFDVILRKAKGNKE